MWVRQCDVDARTEAPPPIPARIASNEEFLPPPQSPRQREYEARLATLCDRVSRRHSLSRRAFLATGAGMAAAMAALNQVFGPCYVVRADEVADQDAYRERWPKNQFVFDMQTHHTDLAYPYFEKEASTCSINYSRVVHYPRFLLRPPNALTSNSACSATRRAPTCFGAK
jgi:hypothetical protein